MKRKLNVKTSVCGTVEMTQWLGVLAALTEDQSSIPRTYIRLLIMVCNTTPEGSDTSLPP